MIDTKIAKSHRHLVCYTFLMALALVSFSFLLQGNIGLNLADEGFLWYGTIQTADGKIPILDFRSKDPGRYYWTAGWSLIFGQGIMDLRLSVALFQVIGLTLGLLAARRVITNWWILGLLGLLLLACMHPWWKLFDSCVAMAAVYIAIYLIELPIFHRYFFSGVFVGLAAFFGRNHGLYIFLAFFSLIFFIWFRQKQGNLFKLYILWLLGIVVGYIPMLFMMIFIPGMFETYLFGNVLRHFKNGFTAGSLPLPISWPWTIDYIQLDLLAKAEYFFYSLFSLLLPIFYISTITLLVLSRSGDLRRHSLLIASSFVGIFYMHHAFDRADLPHLAHSIHPFLLGFVALLYTSFLRNNKFLKISLAILIFASTVFAVVIPSNPYIEKLRFKDTFIPYNITGDQLWLPKDLAAYIETIKQLVAKHVTPDESLFIAPHSPGLYPILQRRAPVHNTYMLIPTTEDKQKKIIKDLKKHKVNWVILSDFALDGRDDLRFRHTHPLVWQYLMTYFEPIDTQQLPSSEQFLRRKIPL